MNDENFPREIIGLVGVMMIAGGICFFLNESPNHEIGVSFWGWLTGLTGLSMRFLINASIILVIVISLAIPYVLMLQDMEKESSRLAMLGTYIQGVSMIIAICIAISMLVK